MLLSTAAPWWVIVTLVGCGLLLAAAQTVFPQESADRLAWWRLFLVERREVRAAAGVSCGIALPEIDASPVPTASTDGRTISAHD